MATSFCNLTAPYKANCSFHLEVTNCDLKMTFRIWSQFASSSILPKTKGPFLWRIGSNLTFMGNSNHPYPARLNQYYQKHNVMTMRSFVIKSPRPQSMGALQEIFWIGSLPVGRQGFRLAMTGKEQYQIRLQTEEIIWQVTIWGGYKASPKFTPLESPVIPACRHTGMAGII